LFPLDNDLPLPFQALIQKIFFTGFCNTFLKAIIIQQANPSKQKTSF